MPGNLSSIGFEFETDADYVEAVERIAGSADRRLGARGGDYAIWQSDCGCALWLHLGAADASGERDVIGLTPFFEGSSELDVVIMRAFQRPQDNPFEGAWEGMIDPGPDGDGGLPIVMDAVDYAARKPAAYPHRTRMRVVAFARDVTAYPVLEGTDIETGRPAPVAREGFYPVGHITEAEAADEAGAAGGDPSSFALLLGRVHEAHDLTNADSGLAYHWLVVECQGSRFDVVAAPDAVQGAIVENGMVEVTAQMFGRWL